MYKLCLRAGEVEGQSQELRCHHVSPAAEAFSFWPRSYCLFRARAKAGCAAAAQTDSQILCVLRQLCSLFVSQSPYQKGGWGWRWVTG